MQGSRLAPYGSWKSPITSDLVAAGTVTVDQVKLSGDHVYWIEQRAAEGGRNVIVRWSPDANIADVSTVADITPPPFNARTRVHEYGGGAYAIDGSAGNGATVYFSNFADQRLYRQDTDMPPRPITPALDLRYADAVVDHRRHRLIGVREDHTVTGREAVNTIAAVNLDGESAGGQVLVSGNTFYSSPRLSPNGNRLAWLTWDHPNMPWDGTELWVGDLTPEGTIANARRVAGGKDESIFQPEWSPDGTLYFVSDRTDWWNLYRWTGRAIEPLHEMAAEFGAPQWNFGLSTYAFESPRRIICAYTQNGKWSLASLDTTTRQFEPIPTPYTNISSVHASPGRVLFIGGSPTQSNTVVLLDLATRQFRLLRPSSGPTIDPGYLSIPQPIEYPTEGGLTAHAFYYPPTNRDYSAPPGEKPPLLVISHGGPTSATNTSRNLSIQYWTSHGFAVVDVNYGGSTGYGRAYRERLKGTWGIVDVNDCVNAARYLAARGEAAHRGLADPQRLAIRGGSAGGYTTLAALAFTKAFHAGASYYGVSDLAALAQDTHKFESRYLDGLVGPLPEQRELYRQRSPIEHTDQLSSPMILFQGLEDKVVPPSQAELMVKALRAKKLPVAYVAFEGEQHGFRRAENIKRTLDAELYFYSRIFHFALADPVPPVAIENLEP